MCQPAVPASACLLALATWVGAAQAQAQEPTGRDRGGLKVYALARSEAFTNGLPIFALEGDWSRGYTPTGGTLRGFEVARAEAGMGWAGWRIGALARAEAYATLSSGAATLAYHYQHKSDPIEGEVNNADARAFRWVGQGLALHSADLPLFGWRLGASIDLLRLRKLRYSQSSGAVSFTGGEYAFDVNAQDQSPTRVAPFMAAADPSGQASSLSLRASTQWGESWRLHLRADDAWSRVRWQGVNSEVERINSATSQVTPDGYVDYAALIQGRNIRETVRRHIPTNLGAKLLVSYDGFDFSAEATHRYGLTQGWIGVGSTITSAFGWQVRGEPWAHAYEFGLSYAGLSFTAGADRLDSAAHMRRASLAWNAPL